MEPTRTLPELYATALAMEEEAARRYVELAIRALDDGNRELADLFWQLGREEGRHYAGLLRASADMVLPRAASVRVWDPGGAPETAPSQLALRLMTPRQAIAMAIEAERRARDFYNDAARWSPDPAVRSAAREMANEENEHIALLVHHMERAPATPNAYATAWERLFIEKAA